MSPLLLGAFLAGHVSHVLAFRRGEWDNHAQRIIAGAGLLGLASAAALHAAAPADGWLTSLRTATSLALAAAAGVLVSMLAYRTLFHALRRYPGPFAARLSSAYISYTSRRFRLHDELERLHKEHGDIVRISPSTISARKPEAVQAVHGPRSKCYKGPWYEQGRPLVALSNIRDRTEYSDQRRIWDQGLNAAGELPAFHFETTPPSSQRPRSGSCNASKAAADASTPANGSTILASTSWVGWPLTDPFDVLSTGEPTYWMKLISKNLDLIGVLAHVPWFFLLLKETPIFKATVNTFRAWLRKQVTVQMERLPETSRSLFASILKDFPSEELLTEKQHLQLQGDMLLILIAGSDTIAMTLQALFYELCINPDAQRKLQQEIDKYLTEHGGGGGNGGEDGDGDGSRDPVSLARLDHLQACVNEALRLWSPVSCGATRSRWHRDSLARTLRLV
ncbi:Cytochrome P450 [Cordyceps fumosorosea ARSEF 2679]|uniref:Cytochrome P450 n=1 Tax=Cordyceps fumosorosea (strain ARSEF 2679) TaxID=1081104 RepID=A0A162KDX0_CORFA|nr:Cytochrome P450 [Cordyceps fumosorosea ARSEF 2679]OAA49704.1 Cytochrome P450 [Cordyceps fumosorosea ARSEF 2679]